MNNAKPRYAAAKKAVRQTDGVIAVRHRSYPAPVDVLGSNDRLDLPHAKHDDPHAEQTEADPNPICGSGPQ